MDRRIMARLVCALSMGIAGLAHGQQQGTVTYVYTDPQGTPLAEADANGNITATYDYTPYGTTALGTPPNGPGYSGHVNDPETNLVYMNARYYDPATGRFLSTDPKALAPADVDNFDRYDYANSNPIRYTDPDGRYACGSGTTKAQCTQITQFVKTMNKGLAKLNKNSSDYKALSAVSQHIGTLNDNNGVTLNAASLSPGVIANAPSSTSMNIDVAQASTLSAPFRQYNPHMSSGQLAEVFGAGAVAHEGRHQIDYDDPDIGFPTNPTTEHRTEMNAYQTEVGVYRGLGASTDLYAPGASLKDINARVSEGAAASTQYWCGSSCKW